MNKRKSRKFNHIKHYSVVYVFTTLLVLVIAALIYVNV